MRFLDKGWKKIIAVIIKLLPQKYTNVGLNLLGIRVGNNSTISKTTYFQTNRVEIGNNVYINKFCEFHTGIGQGGRIIIEDDCDIAMGVKFICETHEMCNGGGRRAGKDVYKTIHIKEKCWIGAEVLILPGVTIGKGCVVAAGDIVTTDVEENTMVAGVPARIIKRLPVL